MPDLQAADVQDQAAPESTARTDGGGQAEANVGGTDVQPGQAGNAESAGALSPELEQTKKNLIRDYHEKTQRLAEEKRQLELERAGDREAADSFRGLAQQEWFKRAIQEEKARRSGALEDLTDEDFDALRTDKRAWTDKTRKLVERIVESRLGQVGQEVSNTRMSLEEIQHEREFNSIASKYKDFEVLNEQGAFDEYLKSDPSITFKEAYALYKLDHPGNSSNGSADIEKEAVRLLDEKKSGAVERNGVAQVRGKRIVKAKNYDDAFQKAWESVSRGEDVELQRERHENKPLASAKLFTWGTANVDSLLTTTQSVLAKTKDFLNDAVFNSIPLLRYLEKNEQIKRHGGASILVPLLYGKNGTFKAYSKDDVFDTQGQEGMTMAYLIMGPITVCA